MAKYNGPVCRLCRREGQKLFLKGDRCYSDKCAIARRAYAPGQHGQGRKKTSEYGLQLRAKQMAKRYYGVLEGQFAKYFEIAEKKQGITGENLLQLLESRLDNVVYRLGFASSRQEAKQLVRHCHFTVNGHKANIPSMLLVPGDVIAVAENFRSNEKFKSVLEATSAHPIPKWLDLNREQLDARILQLPAREEIDLEVEEQLIVELYSK